MIYSVKISAQAEDDLKGIFEYIAFDLMSLQNANAQIGRLESNILKLKKCPSVFVYTIKSLGKQEVFV